MAKLPQPPEEGRIELHQLLHLGPRGNRKALCKNDKCRNVDGEHDCGDEVVRFRAAILGEELEQEREVEGDGNGEQRGALEVREHLVFVGLRADVEDDEEGHHPHRRVAAELDVLEEGDGDDHHGLADEDH